MNGATMATRSLRMTDYEDDRMMLAHPASFPGRQPASTSSQITLRFGSGSPVRLSLAAPSLQRQGMGYRQQNGVSLKHEICEQDQTTGAQSQAEDSPPPCDKQTSRPRKPHLQGRFSGRLATKEDEKKLVDECRLLGPLLGGVGKRGDRSRLTLAKIVRGIAAGEVRRFCEERENRLKVLKNKLAAWEQSGRQQMEGLQQENRALRHELDASTRRLRELEKAHGNSTSQLASLPAAAPPPALGSGHSNGQESTAGSSLAVSAALPAPGSSLQGQSQAGALHPRHISEDGAGVHLQQMHSGDGMGGSLVMHLSGGPELQAGVSPQASPQVVQVVHAAQAQVVQANQAVQASLVKAQAHGVKYAEAAAHAHNLHMQAQVNAQAQADIQAQVMNLKQHMKQMQVSASIPPQVVVDSEMEAHNLQMQAAAHAQAAMEANLAAKRYDAAAQAHASAQAAAQAQAQELHMKAQSLQAQVEQLQHSAAAAQVPAAQALQAAAAQIPQLPISTAFNSSSLGGTSQVTTGIPPPPGGLMKTNSFEQERARFQLPALGHDVAPAAPQLSMPSLHTDGPSGSGNHHQLLEAAGLGSRPITTLPLEPARRVLDSFTPPAGLHNLDMAIVTNISKFPGMMGAAHKQPSIGEKRSLHHSHDSPSGSGEFSRLLHEQQHDGRDFKRHSHDANSFKQLLQDEQTQKEFKQLMHAHNTPHPSEQLPAVSQQLYEQHSVPRNFNPDSLADHGRQQLEHEQQHLHMLQEAAQMATQAMQGMHEQPANSNGSAGRRSPGQDEDPLHMLMGDGHHSLPVPRLSRDSRPGSGVYEAGSGRLQQQSSLVASLMEADMHQGKQPAAPTPPISQSLAAAILEAKMSQEMHGPGPRGSTGSMSLHNLDIDDLEGIQEHPPVCSLSP